jgi:hypothetical protein
MSELIKYLSQHPEVVDVLINIVGFAVPYLFAVKLYIINEGAILDFIWRY